MHPKKLNMCVSLFKDGDNQSLLMKKSDRSTLAGRCGCFTHGENQIDVH
jgi:hypothetical protein